MTDGEESSLSSKALNIEAVLTDDKRNVSLQFSINETVAWSAIANAVSIDALDSRARRHSRADA